MASSVAFILLSLLGLARAQTSCNGQPIPEAAGLAESYPPISQVAHIMEGDTVARGLFDSIMATYNPSLSYPVSQAPGGNLSFDGYDCLEDSQCWWSCSTCKEPKLPGLPEDYWDCEQPSTWGLTFDDGPTCDHDKLYAFLAQKRQLATLYYIGTNCLKWPEEAQKGYLAGHEICVHTWSHSLMTSLTNEEVFAELYYTKKIIKQLTGASTRCWRPAYGDLDDRVRFIAASLDLRAHLWSHDTFDYTLDSGANATVVLTNERAIINKDNSNSGVVVLSHETSLATCNMAIREYPRIAAAWDNIVPVSTCNSDPVWGAEDDQPILPSFQQYLSGSRGAQRTSAGFWNDGELVFIANEALDAQKYSPVSSSTSAPASSPTSSASLPPRLSQGSDVQTIPSTSSARSLVTTSSALIFGLLALSLVV